MSWSPPGYERLELTAQEEADLTEMLEYAAGQGRGKLQALQQRQVPRTDQHQIKRSVSDLNLINDILQGYGIEPSEHSTQIGHDEGGRAALFVGPREP